MYLDFIMNKAFFFNWRKLYKTMKKLAVRQNRRNKFDLQQTIVTSDSAFQFTNGDNTIKIASKSSDDLDIPIAALEYIYVSCPLRIRLLILLTCRSSLLKDNE